MPASKSTARDVGKGKKRKKQQREKLPIYKYISIHVNIHMNKEISNKFITHSNAYLPFPLYPEGQDFLVRTPYVRL